MPPRLGEIETEMAAFDAIVVVVEVPEKVLRLPAASVARTR